MKYLFILILLSAISVGCKKEKEFKAINVPDGFDSTGTMFVIKGMENLIDPLHQRIVKDTFVDFGYGSIPGNYNLVKYNYK